MSIWNYKVITSGKGGFATPALLETFLNQLGADGWEIIHFQSPADNALAFTGLARRSSQRDWTLEDAAAAAAKVEGDKLRAEFEAKFRGGAAAGAEDKTDTLAGEGAASDDGLRRLRDTERDLDSDAPEEAAEPDEWDGLGKEEELPTFFEAIQPLMRRNQRGEGLSVGVDHLAKKWGMTEDDVLGALKECGFSVPDDENARPAYLEYDGDLYWVNINRRGELWINTKEKRRSPFRVVAGVAAVPPEGAPAADAPAASSRETAKGAERAEAPDETRSAPPAERAPIAAGPELLERIRPHMRRNRQGHGGSGSLSFLSRALKCGESDLLGAFNTIGLALPASPEEKPIRVDFGSEDWWLHRDHRGAVWISGEVRGGGGKPKASPPAEGGAEGEPSAPAAEASPPPASGATPSAPATGTNSVFAGVRLLLKPTKTGSLAGKVDRLAETLAKSPEEFLATLTAQGLKVPEKPKEKPAFVEDGSDIFWLNRNAKGELWLNVKASKFAVGEDPPKKKSRRTGSES